MILSIIWYVGILPLTVLKNVVFFEEKIIIRSLTGKKVLKIFLEDKENLKGFLFIKRNLKYDSKILPLFLSIFTYFIFNFFVPKITWMHQQRILFLIKEITITPLHFFFFVEWKKNGITLENVNKASGKTRNNVGNTKDNWKKKCSTFKTEYFRNCKNHVFELKYLFFFLPVSVLSHFLLLKFAFEHFLPYISFYVALC